MSLTAYYKKHSCIVELVGFNIFILSMRALGYGLLLVVTTINQSCTPLLEK